MRSVSALGPRERGAAGSLTRHPHRRAGAESHHQGPTTTHRATTRIVGIEPRLQCIRPSRTHPPAVYRGDHLSAVPALKTRRPWSSDQKSCHGAGASEVPSIRPSAAPFEGACARLAPPPARSASRRPGGRCGAGGSASWPDCALGARLIQVKIASLFQASGESARCRCPWSQTRNPASCCRHRRMRTRPARKEFCTDRSASP